MKLCKDCKTLPVMPGSCKKDRFAPHCRCLDCHRRFKMLAARQRRKRRREERARNADKLELDGYQICVRCNYKRELTEFRTSQPKGKGKRNKICDRCLTVIYSSTYRDDPDMGPAYWRRRAYTCNNAALHRLKKETRDNSLSVSDLQFMCKPQDLAKKYREQEGKCRYCGVDLNSSNTGVDHSVPLSRGGDHVTSNLSLVCVDCNSLKAARNPDEFVEFLRDYVSRFANLSAELPDKEQAG